MYMSNKYHERDTILLMLIRLCTLCGLSGIQVSALKVPYMHFDYRSFYEKKSEWKTAPERTYAKWNIGHANLKNYPSWNNLVFAPYSEFIARRALICVAVIFALCYAYEFWPQFNSVCGDTSWFFISNWIVKRFGIYGCVSLYAKLREGH